MLHQVSAFTRARFFKILVQAVPLLIAVILGAVFLSPFLWMISTSLKGLEEVYAYPPRLLPKPVVWRNYLELYYNTPMLVFLKNSVVMTLGVTVGTAISSSLVAYSFARLRFRGRDLLFMLLLATMMLPPQVTMIPIYLLFSRFGWVNTFKPFVVPSFFVGNPFLGSPFFVFLLRQFFMTIPHDLDDAAKIDGCGYLDIFFRILLPQCKPALVTMILFAFTWTWNEFMGPLIYLNTFDKYTIVMGLRLFQGRFGQTHMHLLMALSIIAVLPVVILFLLAQKQFVEGITLTGMKN